MATSEGERELGKEPLRGTSGDGVKGCESRPDVKKGEYGE